MKHHDHATRKRDGLFATSKGRGRNKYWIILLLLFSLFLYLSEILLTAFYLNPGEDANHYLHATNLPFPPAGSNRMTQKSKINNGTEIETRQLNNQSEEPHWVTTSFGGGSENNQSIIPHNMILIDSSLLWCPNAKAGTTTMYDNILFPNNLVPEQSRKGARCGGNCTLAAWRQLKTWNSTNKPPSFTIVRNPWDRLRSAYMDKVAPGKIQIWDEEHGPIKRFADFVHYVEQHPTENVHWVPMTDRCLTGPSRKSQRLYNGRYFHYDHIIKMEEGDLMSRIESIFKQAGVHLPAGIRKGRRNVSSNKSNQPLDKLVEFYREEAAVGNTTIDELVASVGRTYRDDIEAHGYSFPPY